MLAAQLLAQEQLHVDAGPILGGLLCILPFLIVGLLGTVFWLWMLIDCLANEPSGNDKILWTVVILLTHLLGAILYYFIRRPQRMRGG